MSHLGSVVLALGLSLTAFAGLPACVKRPAPPDSQSAAEPGTGSPLREPPPAPVEVPEADETVAVEAEATPIAHPTSGDDVPEAWPIQVPHPPGLEITDSTPPDFFNTFVRAQHSASSATLYAWFAQHLGDAGWMVLRRDMMSGVARLRLAQGNQRWLLVVGPAPPTPEGTGDTALQLAPWGAFLELRRQNNEAPIEDTRAHRGTSECSAALPPTPTRTAASCRLEVGEPVLAPQPGQSDAAVGPSETAVVFVEGGRLQIMTVGQFEVLREPVDLGPADHGAVLPRVVPAADQGWLVSWVDSHPLERRVVYVDRRLRRPRRAVRMASDLEVASPVAFEAFDLNRREEYAAVWVESQDGVSVFGIAGVKTDGQRVRRSGRFPTGSGPIDGAPVLAYDGDETLAVIWGSADGVFLRTMGTDGLPDNTERRLEPGRASWLGATWADDSYWVAWQTAAGHTAWVRTDASGCVDDARGFIDGPPLQLLDVPTGPLIVTQTQSGVALHRLADPGLGDDVAYVEAEPVGASDAAVGWSAFAHGDDGIVGIVEIGGALHGAVWRCESP